MAGSDLVRSKAMNSPIDRLTALDQLMLRASAIWPQDIGALALLDGTNLLEPSGRPRPGQADPDLDVFAAGVREELHALDDDARSSPKPLVKAEGRW